MSFKNKIVFDLSRYNLTGSHPNGRLSLDGRGILRPALHCY